VAIDSRFKSDHSILFLKKPALRSSILLLMFITAFGIRLYHINTPPMDFATLRQYQSAHIARGYYFEHLSSIPEWRRKVVALNTRRMGLLLEPRILEHLAVFGYRILGGEYLWIPRVFSSIFWLVGGLFLYLIARRIGTPEAALFSTSFFLFLPFSISASRSFQPDPLMVMMLTCSIFTIIQYYDQPSRLRLLLAAVTASLAILVKPYSLFLIYCVFTSIAICRYGLKEAVINRNFMIFLLLSFLPTLQYYIVKILSNVGFLQEQAQASFLPHLLLKSYFWIDWLSLIGQTVGYISFAGAIVGLLMIRKGFRRAVLLGLWTGYFIFGFFFTLHIHTHGYYQLPFVPVVALSLGPVGVGIINFFYRRW